MLGTIISGIAGSFLNNAIAAIGAAYQAYVNKEISKAELDARVAQAALTARTEIEKSSNEAIAKTFDSFMVAAAKSRLMQIMWAIALGTQIFVLFWYQFIVPFIVFLGLTTRYPSAGSTIDWAYALIAGLLGLGPVILRAGPGAGNITEQLKSLRRS